MKIRNGFVSNSSSSSFTIYGWTEDVFENVLKNSSPLLDGMRIDIDEYQIIENLEKFWDDPYSLTCCCDSEGRKVFGLGRYGTEIDHYVEDWENFYYDEPTDEEKEKFDKLAKELKLPKPQIIKEAFYE